MRDKVCIENDLVGIARDILAQEAILKFLQFQAREMQSAIETNRTRQERLIDEAKRAGITGRYFTREELASMAKG
jgi:hypothetical protein